MSRRLHLALGLTAVAGAGVYLLATRDGSARQPAAAASAPAAGKHVARGAPGGPAHGPTLESPDPGASSTASEQVRVPQPHVSPDVAARAVRLAGSRDPAPTSTAGVSGSRLTHPPGEIESMRDAALAVLAEHPKDVDALRVVVSTACALNDPAAARKYNAALPPGDRVDMARTCHQHGVELEDSHWKAGEATPTAMPRPPKQPPAPK